jgi:PE family
VSFVIVPETVTAAAGNLAGIGSTLTEATTAAAVRTTSITAAAADEVSIALARLFGWYGQQFQALSAEAAAFHDEFVGSLKGSAAAFFDTELGNAAATTDPILGGLGPILGGGTGGGGILGGLGSVLNGAGQQFGALLTAQFDGFEVRLLPALFAAGMTASAAGDPWQMLVANTGANLQTIFNDWAAHPFPALHQVISNQNGYANTIGTALALELQNFPTTLANVPANTQLGVQDLSAVGPTLQAFITQQNSYNQATGAALQQFGVDIQKTLPVFEYDLGQGAQSLMTGDYHGAVQAIPRAFLDLFVSGVDIKLAEVDLTNPSLISLTSYQVEGPAGDLLPLSSISAEQEQSVINLLTTGSIPQQIAQNFVSVINTSLLPVGFGIIGPPISALDGLATGATAFGAALATGNGVAAVGALVDMPAYALNGFLNGDTVIDLTIPVTDSVTLPALPPLITNPIVVAANTPIVVHLPFDGILTPPQQISATLDVETGLPIQPVQAVTLSFGGTQFGGLLPELINYIPEQIASTISPK